MISLSQIVWTVVYVLIAAGIFGLLKLLIDKNPWLPSEWKPTINYIFLVLIVLFLIGVLISLITGTTLIRMN